MIYVNDNPFEISGQQSLINLFKSFDINIQKGTAIALNNTVIPKQEWETVLVKDNDKIILIKAAQGG